MRPDSTPRHVSRLAVRQLSKDEAVALAKTGWWASLPAERVAQFQLSQQLLCMDFDAFHEVVEQSLGRPVYTHEFASPDLLWRELHEQKLPPTMEDILELLLPNAMILFLEGNADAI